MLPSGGEPTHASAHKRRWGHVGVCWWKGVRRESEADEVGRRETEGANLERCKVSIDGDQLSCKPTRSECDSCMRRGAIF